MNTYSRQAVFSAARLKLCFNLSTKENRNVYLKIIYVATHGQTMSLCYCIKQKWQTLKNFFYGYEEENYKGTQQKNCRRYSYISDDRQGSRHVHFGKTLEEYRVEHTENLQNYCIPKRQVFNAHGIDFDNRDERDAFQGKMDRMQKLLTSELREIRQQHILLAKERIPLPLINSRIRNGKQKTESVFIGKDNKRNTNLIKKKDARPATDTTNFVKTNDNPLLEEVSLVNDIQDVLDHMYCLSKKIKEIQKTLNIEIRERTLHPEPRLVQIKAPEDKFSQQMKQNGGFRYHSTDRSEQTIAYDTLPPPLKLSDLLTKQARDGGMSCTERN